jgi:transcriptional regulator with XRE-family HTH domain
MINKLDNLSNIMNQIQLELGGESQEAIARRLDVSYKAVNSWFNGKAYPRDSNIIKIEELCEELNIFIDI